MEEESNWATFYFNVEKFSAEFQNEMSVQLHRCFNAMIEKTDFANENGFKLLIGKTDLKTVYQDGYAFSLVEIIGPNHFSKSLTIYWKSNDNIAICNSNEVNSENVEFGWCEDFEKDQFINYNVEDTVKSIQQNALGFHYTAGFSGYPVLNVVFRFNIEVSEQLENEIHHIVEKTLSSAKIISNQTSKNVYRIKIDFKKKKLENTILEINDLVGSLTRNAILEAIEIE